jgi:hypothetical protein
LKSKSSEFSEKQIQLKISELISSEKFFDHIQGKDQIDEVLKKEQGIFMPSFLIDFKLRMKYCQAAKRVLGSFSLTEEITGSTIKNISLDPNNRLFPDYTLFNPEQGTFLLLELKKDAQTEREAITELFAYALELKNHLPLIANSDIKLVIISAKFNALLEHAISLILLGTSFDILCLKVFGKHTDLQLELHFPNSWTDIWQKSLPMESISTVSLIPYLNSKENSNLTYEQIMLMTMDLIAFEGNRVNSNGFAVFWKSEPLPGVDEFGITICQVNPFLFLAKSIENGFVHNANQPLAKFILEKAKDWGEYHHPQSLFDVASPAKKFLDQYYNVHFEGFHNWKSELCTNSYYREQAFPQMVESWGDIGEYFRYFYLLKSTQEIYFKNHQTFGFAYKDPFIAHHLINVLTGNILFFDGVFNATSIYKFLNLLSQYLNLCRVGLHKKPLPNFLKAKLFYTAVDISCAVKEINLRLKGATKNFSKPPSFQLFVLEIDKDPAEDIDKFLEWFATEFIGKENLFYHSAVKDFFNWSQFLEDDSFLRKVIEVPAETKLKFEEEISLLIKQHCISTLNEVNGKQNDVIFNEERNLLNTIFQNKFTYTKSKRHIIEQTIMGYKSEDLVEEFKYFLQLVDITIGEVFHPMTNSMDLNNIDWEGLKSHLLKRYKEGLKFPCISIASNGDVSIGQLPEPRIFGPIEDPDVEVFLRINDAGIQSIQKAKWYEVVDGSFWTK